MNEAGVKRKIVEEFKAAGHYARRIEDSFSVGFPDLVLAHRIIPVFFCEVKMIAGFSFGPTPRQFVELSRLAVAKYTVPCIAGYKDRSLYINEWVASVHIDDCVKQQDGESIVQLFERFYHERRQKYSRLDA